MSIQSIQERTRIQDYERSSTNKLRLFGVSVLAEFENGIRVISAPDEKSENKIRIINIPNKPSLSEISFRYFKYNNQIDLYEVGVNTENSLQGSIKAVVFTSKGEILLDNTDLEEDSYRYSEERYKHAEPLLNYIEANIEKLYIPTDKRKPLEHQDLDMSSIYLKYFIEITENDEYLFIRLNHDNRVRGALLIDLNSKQCLVKETGRLINIKRDTKRNKYKPERRLKGVITCR